MLGGPSWSVWLSFKLWCTVIEFDKNQTRRYFDVKVIPSCERGPLFLFLVCKECYHKLLCDLQCAFIVVDTLGKYSSKQAFYLLCHRQVLASVFRRAERTLLGKAGPCWRIRVLGRLAGWAALWDAKQGGCESCLALVIPLFPEPRSLVVLSAGCGWLYLECYKHPCLS